MVAATRSTKQTNTAEERFFQQLHNEEVNTLKKNKKLQEVCLRGVVEDVESQIHNEYSLAHSISLKAFTMKNNGEFENYSELIIFNNAVINHPELKLNFKLQEKITKTVEYIHESGLSGKNVSAVYCNSVYDMIKEFVKFINKNGKIIFGHNLLGDLIFLRSTQAFCGGKIAIKESVKKEDKISQSITISGWSNITLIDTLPTLSFYAPKTLAKYKNWAIKNKEATLMQRKDYPMRLEILSRCVTNDQTKIQAHIAPNDTEDLLQLMKFMAQNDGPKCLMSQTNRIGKFMPGRPVLSDYQEE